MSIELDEAEIKRRIEAIEREAIRLWNQIEELNAQKEQLDKRLRRLWAEQPNPFDGEPEELPF